MEASLTSSRAARLKRRARLVITAPLTAVVTFALVAIGAASGSQTGLAWGAMGALAGYALSGSV